MYNLGLRNMLLIIVTDDNNIDFNFHDLKDRFGPDGSYVHLKLFLLTIIIYFH